MPETTDLARMRELYEQIVTQSPGVTVYTGGVGRHLFTELADPDNPLWPGGAGQLNAMQAGQSFAVHAHHCCTETLVLVCGLLDISVGGKVLRMSPGDSYRLLPGEGHAATAVTDCIVVGITVPRDGGYPEPEGGHGPDRLEPGPVS